MKSGLCYKSISVLFLSLVIHMFASAQEHEQEQYGAVCNITENESCFTNDNFDFEACPPGFHLNNIYTLCDDNRFCCPCPNNTFQPWWNECKSCILCTDCSEMNKETLHFCNITHNSVCGKELISTVAPTVVGLTLQSTTTTSTPTVSPGEEPISENLEPPDDPGSEKKNPDCTCPSFLLRQIFIALVFFLVPTFIFLRFPDVARNGHDWIVAHISSSNNNQKSDSSAYGPVPLRRR